MTARPELRGHEQTCDPEHGCITCGDVAAEMRVVRVDDDRALALCEAGDGSRQSVETALVEPVAPGDMVLVHAGTAIAAVDEEAAEA